MNIYFDYQNDAGSLQISTITETKYDKIGEYRYGGDYFVLPLKLANTADWHIIIYEYDANTERLYYSQTIDGLDECSISRYYCDITNTYLAMANNDTQKLYLYQKNNQWEYLTTLNLSYTTTLGSDSLHVRISGDIIAVSDWSRVYSFGVGNVELFKKGIDGVFETFLIIIFGGSLQLGYSLELYYYEPSNYLHILIGDPLYNGTGMLLYYYMDFVVISTSTFFPGTAGGEYGMSLDMYEYNSGADIMAIVGEPGYSGGAGRVRIYDWASSSFSITETGTITYPANPGFGNHSTIFMEENILIASSSRVIEFKWNGSAWVLTLSLENPKTYGINYLTSNEKMASMGIDINPLHIYTLKNRTQSTGYDDKIYTDRNYEIVYIKSLTSSLNDSSSTLTINMGFSIAGIYQITLSMANNINTIDTHNNTLYFMYVFGNELIYDSVSVASGTYTEEDLAAEINGKMYYYITNFYTPYIYYDTTLNKYVFYSTNLLYETQFSLGSLLSDWYINSLNETILGFHQHNNEPIGTTLMADYEANLDTPNYIGIDIREAVPLTPSRNAFPAVEVDVLAKKDGTNYIVEADDDQRIKFTERTNTMTFSFKHFYNGADLNVYPTSFSGKLIGISY